MWIYQWASLQHTLVSTSPLFIVSSWSKNATACLLTSTKWREHITQCCPLPISYRNQINILRFVFKQIGKTSPFLPIWASINACKQCKLMLFIPRSKPKSRCERTCYISLLQVPDSGIDYCQILDLHKTLEYFKSLLLITAWSPTLKEHKGKHCLWSWI